MKTAGLDVGSRTIVLVTFENGCREHFIVDTGPNPLARSKELLAGRCYDKLVVTGYGRHLVSEEVGGEAVSEISAYATGASHLYPDCRTVIDVGGQDTKVITLSGSGRVERFEMNDRCAAGTGKFLEMMADTLEVDLDVLHRMASSTRKTVAINSLCTVFAGSEVVSLIARGAEPETIARGLHESITSRIAALVRRVGAKERVVFAGGGAMNVCLADMLSASIGSPLSIPESPQIVGALGAALIAKV